MLCDDLGGGMGVAEREAQEGGDTCMLVVVSSLSRVQLFCNSMGYSLPGSSVHGISQARILEWVAISFSKGSSQLGNLNLHLLH